jgi:ribose-phosphate pyrophosphokinase
MKTARSYAKKLEGDLILVDKRRPAHNVAEVMHVVGEVKDKNIIIVDDLIDTGTTFIRTAEALKDRGAKDIIGVCVHPVFSGASLDNLGKTDAVKKVFATDTIPLNDPTGKIEVISVSEILAEAIIRTHDNRSISSLFEIER